MQDNRHDQCIDAPRSSASVSERPTSPIGGADACASTCFLAEDTVRLDVEFWAGMTADFAVRTDTAGGNAARIFYESAGKSWLAAAGESCRRGIGESESFALASHRQEFHGRWSLQSGDLGRDESIVFELECEARGPGGIIVTGDAKYQADIHIHSITVHITEVRQGD